MKNLIESRCCVCLQIERKTILYYIFFVSLFLSWLPLSLYIEFKNKNRGALLVSPVVWNYVLSIQEWLQVLVAFRLHKQKLSNFMSCRVVIWPGSYRVICSGEDSKRLGHEVLKRDCVGVAAHLNGQHNFFCFFVWWGCIKRTALSIVEVKCLHSRNRLKYKFNKTVKHNGTLWTDV